MICDQINNMIDTFAQRLKNSIEETIPETNLDEYETIYSENYACANAALILADVASRKDGDSTALNRMLERCLFILRSRNVNPFCRLFVLHYTTLALFIAPKQMIDNYDKHVSEIVLYNDDCSVINANCAAMKISNIIMIASLSKNVLSEEALNHIDSLLRYVKGNNLGFINDSVSHNGTTDGMPIAYHGFILFLLGTGLFINKEHSSLKEEQRQHIVCEIKNGLDWWTRTLAADGSAAFAGRSRYQGFTWGVTLFLKKLAGHVDESLQSSLNDWIRFRKEDGSYSCTPNYHDHTMRIGFENYTHINMYNNLGISALVLANRLDDTFCAEFFNQDFNEVSTHFIDEESGYAFFKSNLTANSFACVLRTHERKDVCAMSGFHFRWGNEYIPLAENAFDSEIPLFEGIGYMRNNQQMEYILSPQSISVEAIDEGFRMNAIHPDYQITKTITFTPNYIKWAYQCLFTHPVSGLTHFVPLVVNNGKDQLSVYKLSERAINMRMQGVFQLYSPKTESVNLSLERNFRSPSGISSNAELHFSPCDNSEGKRFEIETYLFLMKDESDDKRMYYKVKVPEAEIENISYDICEDVIDLEAQVKGEATQYTWEIFHNGISVYKKETGLQNKLTTEINSWKGHLSVTVRVTSVLGAENEKSIWLSRVKAEYIPCEKNICTGCLACINACPVNCIEVALDSRGAVYPQINEIECIKCNRCTEVCPAKHKIEQHTLTHESCFAAWNTDEIVRQVGTSGGVFAAMASYILEIGGTIFGAVFNEDFGVDIVSSDEVPIESFNGSKYVQSYVGLSYRVAAECLKTGKPVLFSGAPCQIAALQLYLKLEGVSANSLYTVDFICGGFVAEGVFKGYLNALESIRKKKINKYIFRDKFLGWNQTRIRISYEDNQTYLITPSNDPYYTAFQRGDTLRENCFHCPYLGKAHLSDLIIGDYNGWNNLKNFQYDTKKGISQIIVNTSKGKELIAQIEDKIFYEQRSISEAITENKRYMHHRDLCLTGDEFYANYAKLQKKLFSSNIRLSNLVKLSIKAEYDSATNLLRAKAECITNLEEEVLFAWYVFQNGKRVELIWYKEADTISYPIKENGEYFIRVFAKDRDDNKLVMDSNRIQVND